MKPRLLLLPCLLCLVAAPAPASAQKAAAAREVAEVLLKKFGKEVAGESVETLTAKVAQVAARYGDDGAVAIQRVGPRAFQVIADAGEHSAGVVKLMARHGDEAVWVVSQPKQMAIFIKHGEEAAEAMMKHKGIAAPFIEKTGQPGVKALNSVATPNARNLANLVEDGVIVPGGESGRLLDVVGRYGDRAAEFIWRNKKGLGMGAVLTAFLADPEPFIDGAMELPKVVVSQTNWTLVIIVVIIAGMILLGAYLFFTDRIKRPNAKSTEA